MAFTGNFMCNTFKKELLTATHNFTNGTGHTFKMALYDNTPSFVAATTAYTSSGELADAVGGYSRPGKVLTNVTPTNGTPATTALTDFADPVWTSATFTTYGAMIYNDTAAGDPAVLILYFGGAVSVVGGDFTVVFPAADASNAIIRIA